MKKNIAFLKRFKTLLLTFVCIGLLQPAISFADNDAIEYAKKLSDAFEAIADKITPSLVNIQSVAKARPVQYKSPQLPQGMPEQFREFFEQFGGRSFPSTPSPQRGLGSGVIIDSDGHILTNNHVVEGAGDITVRLTDKRTFSAKIIGTDPKTDLAVIKIDASGLKPAVLGNSDKLRIGEWVVAAGSPFGLDNTITTGIVSAKGRSFIGGDTYEDFIQTDAAINPGNSGGPLVDLNGNVIGINTAIFTRSGGYMGIGFAIPINMARNVMQSLIQDGKVTRGYIGVGIQNLTPELAKSFKYSGTGGALVGHVAKDGPGEKAGLKQGDIITTMDGEHIEDINQLRNTVASKKPGTKIALKILRDTKEQSVTVSLGELPAGDAGTEEILQSSDNIDIGAQFEALSPEAAQKLGTDTTKGVLVTRVLPESVAARAGLTPGDIVLKVGDEDIENMNDLKSALSEAAIKEGIRMVVETRGMERFVFLQAE